MYCPQCQHANPADARHCEKCRYDVRYLRARVFVGRQLIFVQADAAHPVTLQVDAGLQTYTAPVILARHQHAVNFGDLVPTDKKQRDKWPVPDQPRLPLPTLNLLTVITDRKIYKPDTAAQVFIIAPQAARQPVTLEIKLAGQKVYEAQIMLNADGLALHCYEELKEGEYTVQVALGNNAQATCTFSVAEFTLSPLIATLEKHAYAQKKLTFTLKLLLLSVPYTGPVELGLQCQVCGERVVATQAVTAHNGAAAGEFDLAGHGGPFHVQVTTPDGNTAQVSFPGTGAVEREHVKINPLGKTFEAGLLPWEGAQPVRGLYIGSGETHMTPVLLESVHTAHAKLQVASSLVAPQVLIFQPRTGEVTVLQPGNLMRGAVIEFAVDAPYTLFTVGAFTQDKPFEGWGIVIKPTAFEAALAAPASAQPGQEIEIKIEVKDAAAPGAFCLLLVYDARLEHESPVPKLAKQIYESMRNASGHLGAGPVVPASEQHWAPPPDFVARVPSAPAFFAQPMVRAMAQTKMADDVDGVAASLTLKADKLTVTAPTLVVAPTRMDFPELAYVELFYLEGQAERTIKLGDQIGTWRARAYVFKGLDYRELTADIQADKPIYAELDLPAIASPGDDIQAAVNYFSREPAQLVITSLWGETRQTVRGAGMERFAIQGPGRVEVRLENAQGADWSVRDIAPPGVQRVTASRLLILDRGQSVAGEKVVVYAALGQVLKDTITALIHYPFG